MDRLDIIAKKKLGPLASFGLGPVQKKIPLCMKVTPCCLSLAPTVNSRSFLLPSCLLLFTVWPSFTLTLTSKIEQVQIAKSTNAIVNKQQTNNNPIFHLLSFGPHLLFFSVALPNPLDQPPRRRRRQQEMNGESNCLHDGHTGARTCTKKGA